MKVHFGPLLDVSWTPNLDQYRTFNEGPFWTPFGRLVDVQFGPIYDVLWASRSGRPCDVRIRSRVDGPDMDVLRTSESYVVWTSDLDFGWTLVFLHGRRMDVQRTSNLDVLLASRVGRRCDVRIRSRTDRLHMDVHTTSIERRVFTG